MGKFYKKFKDNLERQKKICIYKADLDILKIQKMICMCKVCEDDVLMKFGEIFNSDLNHQINTLNIGLDKVEDKVRIQKTRLDEREENLRKKQRAIEDE